METWHVRVHLCFLSPSHSLPQTHASHRCLGLSVCWWKQSSVLGNAHPLFSLRHVVSPLPSPTPCGGAVRVQTQQVANCVPHDQPSQAFTSSMSSCLQTADSRRREVCTWLPELISMQSESFNPYVVFGSSGPISCYC